MNNSDTSWIALMEVRIGETFEAILSTAPSLIGAFIVIIAGWFVARFMRSVVRRLTNVTNRLLERLFRKGALASIRLSTPATAVIADVAFWIVLFLAVTIAARIAGLTAISAWLNQIVAQLPNLVVGALIIAIGYFASLYTGRLIATKPDGETSRESLFVARLTQGFIFITALIIGLDQFGVKVTFLVTLLAVAAGAILAGFSIAFGLGAREHVGNLIAARAAGQALHPGLKLRIGEFEGNLLEVTPSHFALDTPSGRMLIPARVFEETPVEILTGHAEKASG